MPAKFVPALIIFLIVFILIVGISQGGYCGNAECL